LYKIRNENCFIIVVEKDEINIKGKNIIKISWKARSKSDGYVIYKEYNSDLIAIKKINNGSKHSCTIKNNKLEGVKKLYIRPYKKINNIKVYGRKTKLTI